MLTSSLPDIDPTLTSEEATRQWWQQQYGQPLPEEVKQWMKAIGRREVLRARRDEHLLDDNSLYRVRESRRLCVTKSDNIEESLRRLRTMEVRLLRAAHLNVMLQEQRNVLNALNKQQASLVSQKRELERFETFESVSPQFQQVLVLQRQIADARQEQSRLSVLLAKTVQEATDAEKRVGVEREKADSLSIRMAQSRENLMRVQYLQRRNDSEAKTLRLFEELITKQRTYLTVVQQELREKQQLAETLQKQMTELRLQQQTLEAHRSLIEQAGAAIVLLDNLKEAEEAREKIKQELNRTQRSQVDYNGRLEILFQQTNTLQAEIDRLNEEVKAHNESIAGQDSYKLQQKVVALQNRKLMLEMGLSLWRNITDGYELIEQKEQRITQLRQKADQLNSEVDELDYNVKKLQQLWEQKQYQLTLSKSQNVIELRSDLKEGTPCSVCGATNHPWYADNMLSQNAVIGQMKGECDAIMLELKPKRERLLQLQLEQHTTQALIEQESENLKIFQQQQQKNTANWQMFSNLDRTFIDCSRSTNREMRAAMLQQLIDKTTVDADKATQELDNLTFHLNTINDLGQQLQKKQRQMADMSQSLNEVNTACQVVAGRIENYTNRLDMASKVFQQLYDKLSGIITLPNWYQQWRRASEGIKLNIQDMQTKWLKRKHDLQQLHRQIDDTNIELQMLKRAEDNLTVAITSADALKKSLQSQLDGNTQDLTRLNENGDVAQIYDSTLEQEKQQRELLLQVEQLCNAAVEQRLQQQARLEFLKAFLYESEEMMAGLRRQLDDWMRNYNASHPPVQFSELERLFSDNRDWNDVRTQVREVDMAQALTQTKVDGIRAELVALQAEGTNINTDSVEEEIKRLHAQADELWARQREIMQQMVRYDEQLRWHEIAKTL
ncbi:MAG: hypothetical protein J5486_04405 [Bacteroidaceae bacterium]|nr:hypothetical protein [Bacteroidaceae bacterium]